MKVKYPARDMVSVWVGTFRSENDFDQCVDREVVPALKLRTHIASICEVTFQQEAVPVQELLDGFSDFENFIKSVSSVAASRNIASANSILVCYSLECSEASDAWGDLRFLGSFAQSHKE